MRIEKAVCTLLAVTFLSTLSLAQVTYTTSCTGTCEDEMCNYTNWAYTDSSKVKHTFVGSDSETLVSCKFLHFTDLDTFSTDKEYYLKAIGPEGSVSASGILYPLYKVVSIIYAPPGNYSNDGFTNTTTDGTTTGIGSSFQAGWTDTFTTGDDFLGTGSTMSWSFGLSSTTGSNSTVTDTIAQATGVANASISSNPNAIDHTQDLIVVWVNPSVTLVSAGSSSVTYGVGTQFQPSGTPEAVDTLEVTAKTMQANSSGATTVPVAILGPQSYNGQTLPGLATICANHQYYPNSCTLANQCGCVPSDFAGILAADPVLSYSSTESPLNADTSGVTACTNPTSTAKCRYVPIMTQTGGSVQVTELLAGPECTGCDRPVNSFTQTDSTQTAETLSESQSETVGYSWQVMLAGNGLKSADQFTWTQTESTGSINGSSHQMAVSLSSGTVGCYEYIPIFMDTVYHTFVFSTEAGNNSCP
ncbi:MAG TPA: hypothetical protein VGM18_09035 [Candidatus Sulfotelmatobacter sp.]|jgi:hypothetical protein